MNKLMHFIKITVAGGLLFLIPVIVLVVVVSKAVSLLHALSTPLAKQFPITKVAGIGVTTLISVVLLLIICFIAGLFMRTPLAKKLKRSIEENILIYIPGYSYLQALSTDKFSNSPSHQQNWKPASILVDDNEVLCFVIDETEHYCSVFLPAAPVPSSGSVCVREKSLVKFLPINVAEASMLIRKFGKGAADVMEKVYKPTDKKTAQ